MVNIFPLKVIVNRLSALLIFTMPFFMSNVVADVEMVGTDIPIMLKYKDGTHFSYNVRSLPFERAFKIVDRQPLVSDDGGGDRPVWKNDYRMVNQDKNDPIVSEKKSETIKYAKVLELLYFIQLIQKSSNRNLSNTGFSSDE